MNQFTRCVRVQQTDSLCMHSSSPPHIRTVFAALAVAVFIFPASPDVQSCSSCRVQRVGSCCWIAYFNKIVQFFYPLREIDWSIVTWVRRVNTPRRVTYHPVACTGCKNKHPHMAHRVEVAHVATQTMIKGKITKFKYSSSFKCLCSKYKSVIDIFTYSAPFRENRRSDVSCDYLSPSPV